MPLFTLKPRRNRDFVDVSLDEVAQYPLLERELMKAKGDGLPSNPKPRLGSRGARRESSSRSSNRSRSSTRSRRQSYSANQDVALLWMQMAGNPRSVKPLKNSTRHNSVGDNPETKSSEIPKSFSTSSPLTTLFQTSQIRKPSRRVPPPPPPPLASRSRRFRVNFGVMTDWKSAMDPKSGRPYYYNTKTMETQWRKPMELASEAERSEMEEKERKQKEFFASMEANILNSMAMGQIAKPVVIERKASLKKPRALVRTISTMEEGVLKDLVKRTNSLSRSHPAKADNFREEANDFRRPTLERITEGSKELELSMQDIGGSSMMDFNESFSNFAVSKSELKALQDLALISEEMTKSSNDDDMEYSNSVGLDFSGDASIPDFSVSMSDGLDFDWDQGGLKARNVPSIDGLIFSPELQVTKKPVGSTGAPSEGMRVLPEVEKTNKPSKSKPSFGDGLFSPVLSKQSKATAVAPGEIVFTPDVCRREPSAVEFGRVEKKGEPDLRQELKTAAPPKLVKRNSCGTLYVGSTMSAPDKDATIKCICGVYRAHILASEKENLDSNTRYDPTKDKFRLFNDRDSQRKSVLSVSEELVMEDLSMDEIESAVPSLDAITAFYRDVYLRAQMETDCIIMSLIYVERLIKVTDGMLRPRLSNWRSVLFSCMVMASKVWDDLSMWNGDFSQTCPAGVRFTVKRINELELAILKALVYKVKVPASEYAKYYFLLRSMLIKSGLGGDDLRTKNPLDVEGAKKLEQLSSSFQSMAETKRRMLKQNTLRSKSMGDAEARKMGQSAQRGGVSLEHLVKM